MTNVGKQAKDMPVPANKSGCATVAKGNGLTVTWKQGSAKDPQAKSSKKEAADEVTVMSAREPPSAKITLGGFAQDAIAVPMPVLPPDGAETGDHVELEPP